MFRDAYSIARQFTFPVIVSQKTVAGKCTSSIGTFVVVNSDGWFVTAGHIVEALQSLHEQVDRTQNRDKRKLDVMAQ